MDFWLFSNRLKGAFRLIFGSCILFGAIGGSIYSYFNDIPYFRDGVRPNEIDVFPSLKTVI